MNSATVFEFSSMTLGSVGSKSAPRRDLYLRRVFQMCQANQTLSHRGMGILSRSPSSLEDATSLPFMYMGSLDFAIRVRLTPISSTRVARGRRHPGQPGHRRCRRRPEGAGLGAAAGDLLLFQEEDVAVTQSVGGCKTGEATADYYNVEEGVGGGG